MDKAQSSNLPNLQMAIRTLVLSGFKIENNRRQPTHTEIECCAPLLGAMIPLLLALTEEDELPPNICPQIERAAQRAQRTLIVIANSPGAAQLSWIDFLEAFGGGVPSWRALDDTYLDQLEIAGANARPPGFDGEAWRLFESLVADGLEFCFGRRVTRLGAAKRGQRVSDMIALTPEETVLVLDAKATATSFNAAISELRALAEYTLNQKTRQRGFAEVFAAVVVSKGFDQDAAALSLVSREFVVSAGVPVAFLEVSTLAHFVNCFRREPHLRSGTKWKSVFAGGLITRAMFDSEIESLKGERY